MWLSVSMAGTKSISSFSTRLYLFQFLDPFSRATREFTVSSLTTEMGASYILPLVLSASPSSHHFPWQPQLSTSRLHGSSVSPCFSRVRNKRIVVFCTNSGETNGSQFLDEDGVVDDMDGYLNYLSLEYDSVWDTKPSWCQPWTIMLTGISLTAASWFVLRSLAVTTIILLVICLWWYIFLYSYPKAYSDMIANRRKKVTDGVEDTFGLRKSQ